jgi:hypothetical protein
MVTQCLRVYLPIQLLLSFAQRADAITRMGVKNIRRSKMNDICLIDILPTAPLTRVERIHLIWQCAMYWRCLRLSEITNVGALWP